MRAVAVTGKRRKRKVQGKDSPETYEVLVEVIEVTEVGRKMRESG